jgi:hypothetical protein
LKDKKNQQKVKQVLHKVKNHTKGYLEKVKTQKDIQQEKAEKKLDEGKKLIAQATNSVKSGEKNNNSK